MCASLYSSKMHSSASTNLRREIKNIMAFAIIVFSTAIITTILGAVIWTALIFISAKLNHSKATLREIIYRAWH